MHTEHTLWWRHHIQRRQHHTGGTCGVQNSLESLYILTHTEHLLTLLCGDRKPLLQMALLSTLNGGFLQPCGNDDSPRSCTLPFLSFTSNRESTKRYSASCIFSTTEKAMTYILYTQLFERELSESKNITLYSAKLLLLFFFCNECYLFSKKS